MINFLLVILFASIFVFDWLFFVMGVGGRVMTWVPEFVALFIALSLPLKLAIDKQTNIPFKYGMLVVVYLLNIVIGFVLNDISGWTMLAGLRIYTKFLPIFLVPILYPLSEKAFNNILLWVYALTIVQFPVTLWQRFFQFAEIRSGDPIGGTLGISTSGVLSVYLIAMISFLIAFYFKNQISFPFFLLSILAAFIPTTMNETKVSLVLLPLSFALPAFFIKEKQQAVLRILFVVVISMIALIVFKVVYDYFAISTGRETLTAFVSDEEEFEEYNDRRLKPLIDALVVAPKDDLRFALFGRGVGNVSEGFIDILSGKYLKEAYQYDTGMTFPQLMWETGFLGTILFFMFPVLIIFDARNIAKKSGLEGAYALGMIPFSLIFILSTFYTFTLHSNVLIFIYFFAAGQTVRYGQKTQNAVNTISESSIPA